MKDYIKFGRHGIASAQHVPDHTARVKKQNGFVTKGIFIGLETAFEQHPNNI